MRINNIVNEINVEFHDTLNQQLWHDDQIKIDVQVKLLKIAKKFIDFVNTNELNLVDICILGSNASYNYTQYSDIDLHIMVKNVDDIKAELYDSKKKLWNEIHQISIKGFNVELYIQDIDEPNASMGIFSLLKNKWIKHPKKMHPDIDDNMIQQKFKHFVKLINTGISNRNKKYLDKIAANIKTLRTSGLQTSGEFSLENLVFKELRNGGYLDKLSQARQDLEDESLSLSEKKEINQDDQDLLKRRSIIRKGIGTRHVYKYEDELSEAFRKLSRQLSLRTLTNYTTHIWKKYYDGNRNAPVVRFGPGDMGLGRPMSYTMGYGLIELAPGQQNLITLIHELIHAMGPSLHGTNFTKKYYTILKDFIPKNYQNEVYNELVVRHGEKLKPYYRKLISN